MSEILVFNAAYGTFKTAGPNVLFSPSSGLGPYGTSAGDTGVELQFNDAQWWKADQVSLDGGLSQISFSIVSIGTLEPAARNSNFFNQYPQFSISNPPDYAVISLATGEQLIFFPDFPKLEGPLNGTNFLLETNVVPCFTPGTAIATPQGEKLVEDLKVGDRVITRDNGIQEIRWIGAKRVSGLELAKDPHLKPVLVRKGALGNDLPERDMLVSPNHRLLVNNDKTALYFEDREVLAAAKHMVGAEGIHEVDVMGTTYIHFMFDHHEVVLSNGSWTESFQPGDMSLKGMGKAQRNEIFDLFPELASDKGAEAYQSARRSLKKHEADLLIK